MMAFAYNLLIYIWLLLNFVTMVFCLYEVAIALAAFRKKRPEELKEIPYHRFAAIVAARNEQNVIGSLIESLKVQNYPKGLIDIIVIADNCDDHTAEVAKKAGAIVYKRFNKAEVGKGYVVKFAFEKIFEDRDCYDAFCIFDADNVVDRDFFLHMNRALSRGADVAQGYRDIKNPTDTWVSGCHSLFYWMENRFYNSSRSYLGLSATINGTGFMVSADIIRKLGYNIKTVTEDLEFTMQSVIHDYKVEWVPEAKVYDEQPLTAWQSVTQRTRWTNGYMQCFVGYVKPLFQSLMRKPSWVKLDMLVFLCSLLMIFVGAAAIILYLLLALIRIFDPVSTVVNTVMLFFASLGGFWLIGLLSVLTERKGLRKMAKAILTYPIFNIMWVFIYCKCAFVRSSEWKPIAHGRNIGIEEIESTQTK